MSKRLPAISLIFLLAALLLHSCGGLRSEKRNAIARVYDYYLYEDELLNELPPALTESDSVIFATNYINNWISQKLLQHAAESNLSDIRKDFSRQLEEYRQSLLIFEFEREFIQEKLDTIVTEAQVEEFYNQNNELFVLKDNIVKVLYIKLLLNAPNINLVRNYMKNAGPDDLQKLEDYGARFAANYYLDDENWLFFNDILKEIPIKTYDHENFLRNNRFIETKDSLFHYFIHIRDFKIKESVSPLEFEKIRIAEMLINRRKTLLLNNLREDIFKDATEKGKIEVY